MFNKACVVCSRSLYFQFIFPSQESTPDKAEGLVCQGFSSALPDTVGLLMYNTFS